MTQKFTRRAAGPQFTGFEPGARLEPDAHVAVAPDAPPAAPLESAAGADHWAAFEARLSQMLQEWDGKLSDLKARAADLKQRAHAKEGEFRRLSQFVPVDHNRISALQTEAGNLAQEERRLINIELPKMQYERDQICSGNHPTLNALRLVAQNRVAADIRARQPKTLPSFVVLEAHFAWRENEVTFGFSEGQVVRDPALIGKLIERNAPLSLGATGPRAAA